MNLTIAILIYAGAMTLANLSIAAFGPSISPINAFVLIGLDLSLRDWLHVRLRAWQMFLLIACAGVLTFVLNPEAGRIAIAGAISFTIAAAVDWLVFARMKGSWLKRSNTSNVAGAAVDSILFPTLAFGVLMPEIIALQFIAKVTGGALWSAALNRVFRQNKTI